jgi:hypothetical protein
MASIDDAPCGRCHGRRWEYIQGSDGESERDLCRDCGQEPFPRDPVQAVNQDTVVSTTKSK